MAIHIKNHGAGNPNQNHVDLGGNMPAREAIAKGGGTARMPKGVIPSGGSSRKPPKR